MTVRKAWAPAPEAARFVANLSARGLRIFNESLQARLFYLLTGFIRWLLEDLCAQGLEHDLPMNASAQSLMGPLNFPSLASMAALSAR